MFTPFARKTLTRASFLVWLLLCALVLPVSALAGNTVVIDKPVTHSVVGNGDLPDGALTGNDFANLLDPNNNTVQVVPGGDVSTNVFGGIASNPLGTDTATGNSVTISGGDVGGNVFGGLAGNPLGTDTATATNNSVSISGGQIGGHVYGGVANNIVGTGTATATNNSVSISGGQIGGHVYGGETESDSGNATATGNSVTISDGGQVGGNVYGGGVYSDSGNATANENMVSISGGRVSLDVHGGYSESSFGNATATNNSVTISDGNVTFAVSGGAAINTLGSGTATATATNNSVTISGGQMGGDVLGGYSISGFGVASATGNSVTISGGQVDGRTFGGAAIISSGTGTATNNSVTLSGNPVFGASSPLYGGFVGDNLLATPTPNMDGFSGNTLNVWNYHGSPVASVQSFEYYNFLMPSNVANGDTLLTVTGTADMDDINSLGKHASVSGINALNGGTPLRTGDRVTLLKAGTLSGTLANAGTHIQTIRGISLKYNLLLEQTANELAVTVTDVTANPRAKALPEGRAAGMAFVNQGADLASGMGMHAARNAGSGLGAFAVGQGGASRYNTGSHVDVDGFSLMTGLAWNQQMASGTLLLGAYVEGGWGDYNSHNAFSNAASVKGNGDTNYYGGGVLGRFDFKNNIYTEASFRIGQLDTDFSSSNLRDLMGNRASYDSSSTYYGAHLGLGYGWNITDATSLDLSTKYLWTRQNSDSVTVAGDPITFKASDSHRVRTGARLSHAISTESGLAFKPYIGAAYEHEFDGKAKATTYGYSLDAPDLKGGTGIGELGLSFKPAAGSGLSLDFGVQGYTGVREGASGSFQVKFAF